MIGVSYILDHVVPKYLTVIVIHLFFEACPVLEKQRQGTDGKCCIYPFILFTSEADITLLSSTVRSKYIQNNLLILLYLASGQSWPLSTSSCCVYQIEL